MTRPNAILSRPDLQEAARWFELACIYSRVHSKAVADALRDFGDHGPQISGIMRDHFPDPVKETLRDLAHVVTECSDKAWAARPRGVRLATMRALARAVARRDGSGFYGPQGD